MGGYWRRHPDKTLQSVLGEFHDAGWRIESTKKYYKVYCPCDEKHKTTVHLSPSSGYYANHKLQWLYNQTCYKGS